MSMGDSVKRVRRWWFNEWRFMAYAVVVFAFIILGCALMFTDPAVVFGPEK